MNFAPEIWTIKDLITLYEDKKINLNPPYQRNPIWTKKAQQELIDSVKIGYPLPNFFLHRNDSGSYDMVDGQQRTRAFLQYYNTTELDINDFDIEFKKKKFLEYEITVTIIDKIEPGEFIEDFYSRVNSSGLRLNKPETNKATYHNTRFLDLVEKLTALDEFQSLELVPFNSRKRMMDRDLVEEISVLLINGITDKKNEVDKIYESDISKTQAREIALTFSSILKVLLKWNEILPLKKTRYRQRNDIYTIFGILDKIRSEDQKTLSNLYKVLLEFEKEIRPSKFICRPFSEYAYACVTQSNSKKMRQERNKLLTALLLNKEAKANETQKQVLDYYALDEKAIVNVGNYYTFDTEVLSDRIEKKQNQREDETKL